MPRKKTIPASGRFMIALHPGEILRKLYLEPLGLGVGEAAERLGVTRQRLSQVVNARRSVTPAIALRLEAAFGASAQSWLNMQVNYDLVQERRKGEVTGVRRISTPA